MNNVPKCCIEGCNEVSDHTDVNYMGEVYHNLCESHHDDIFPIRDRKYPTRPECTMPGCDKLAHHIARRKDGSIIWRKHCYGHHMVRIYKRNKSNSISLDKFTFTRENYGDLTPWL